jgi:succinoglycan biosynthesis protein ExoA
VVRPQQDRPFVSVVVPVRNEEAFLGRTLGALCLQDYPSDAFEILVVDGDSTDRTLEIAREHARRWPQIQVLSNPRRWSSAARNIGIRAARGELVLIVDGHCELSNQRYLSELIETFQRTGADCLGRPQPLDVAGASPLQCAIAAARSSRLGHHPGSYIYSDREQIVPAHSVAIAYRKELFAEVGLFDEAFDACEDVELNSRLDAAGKKCVLAPQLEVKYHPRASLRALFQQMTRYGRGRVRLLRKQPHTYSFLGFAPALFLLGLVLGPLAGFISASLLWAYVGAVALYALIVMAVSAQLAIEQRSFGLLWRAPLVFATLHLGSGWGIVREVVGLGQVQTVPC